MLLVSPVLADPAELVVGVFPRRPALQTEQMFAPMVAQLGERLGIRTHLEVPPDFPAFWKAVRGGRYHLVHYNQYHYVRSHKEFGYRVVAMNEEYGESTIRSTLWVRKDSGIRSPSDLKHKKIVFGGGRKAMVSYIMATDLLRQAGLNDRDYITQFTVNPLHAMKAVYYQQGSAAGLSRNAPQQSVLRETLDFDELTPLMVSEPVAMLPWAVSARVDADLQHRITTALLALNDAAEGSAALASADLTALVAATDADYDPHRRIIERVLGEVY
jgi:phosphonate transport system substrate-binding protein